MTDHTLDQDTGHDARGRTGLIVAGVFALLVGLLAAVAYLAPARLVAGLPIPHPGRTFGVAELGGSRVVLQIDASEPTTLGMDGLADQIRASLRAHDVPFADLAETDDGVGLRLLDPGRAAEAQLLISAIQPPTDTGLVRRVEIVRGPGRTVGLKVVDRAAPETAMARAIAVVRNRVLAMGVHDPKVVETGSGRILVEAPGETDVQKLVEGVSRFGRLTFQLVDATVSPEEARAGRLPPDAERLPENNRDEPWIVVQRHVLLTGANLTHVHMAFDDQGKPVVAFTLDAAGTRRFAQVTTENVGKRFAMVMDGQVISAPNILDPITGGSGQITGDFTPKGAQDLALLIATGPLPAPVRVVEQTVVRPRG